MTIIKYFCNECGKEIIPTYEPQPVWKHEMPAFEYNSAYQFKNGRAWAVDWNRGENKKVKINSIYLATEGNRKTYLKHGWKNKIHILQNDDWWFQDLDLKDNEQKKRYIITPYRKGYKYMGIEYEMEMEDKMIFKCECGCEYKSIWDLVERRK